MNKKALLRFSLATIIVASLWLLTRNNLITLLPTNIRKMLPFSITTSFNSTTEALQSDYKKYPTSPELTPLQNESKTYLNQKTGQELVLDTSAGGGYTCCEAPTFYVWVDENENIFWIRTYQASLESVDDNWYGPFNLK